MLELDEQQTYGMDLVGFVNYLKRNMGRYERSDDEKKAFTKLYNILSEYKTHESSNKSILILMQYHLDLLRIALLQEKLSTRKLSSDVNQLMKKTNEISEKIKEIIDFENIVPPFSMEQSVDKKKFKNITQEMNDIYKTIDQLAEEYFVKNDKVNSIGSEQGFILTYTRDGTKKTHEILGKGNSGTVKLSVDTKTNVLLATKTLISYVSYNSDDSDNSSWSDGIKRECDIINDVGYGPANVIFKEPKQDGLSGYKHKALLTMPYYPKTLHNFLKENENMDFDKRLTYCIDLTLIVNDLHQGRNLKTGEVLKSKKKYVHGDLKPDNIYLNQENKLVLGDFGTARDDISTSAFGNENGTPMYWPIPEGYYYQLVPMLDDKKSQLIEKNKVYIKSDNEKKISYQVKDPQGKLVEGIVDLDMLPDFNSKIPLMKQLNLNKFKNQFFQVLLDRKHISHFKKDPAVIYQEIGQTQTFISLSIKQVEGYYKNHTDSKLNTITTVPNILFTDAIALRKNIFFQNLKPYFLML